jgi:uncharacterized protein YndB with AHSA1/START domain
MLGLYRQRNRQVPMIRVETVISAPPEVVFDAARDIDLHMTSAANARLKHSRQSHVQDP